VKHRGFTHLSNLLHGRGRTEVYVRDLARVAIADRAGMEKPGSRDMLAGVRPLFCLLVAAMSFASTGCNDAPAAASRPESAGPNLRIVFFGSTARRSDLPPSAQACVGGVGATHIHPSWRGFAGIPLTPVPPDRYEITFTDVPVGTRVSFRVNDQNACDENPTGAVTRNVFANDVRLVQNTTTPGNGDEPGYAVIVAANGTISQ
jgi:hypothetical protein